MMRTYAQLRDYVKRHMVRMLTAEGRGEDAHLAHLATGEMVLPRRLLDGDPWLRTYLVRLFEDANLDWRTYLVGGPNRINPATGLPEFDPGRDEASDFERGGSGASAGSGGSAGSEERSGNTREFPNPSMSEANYVSHVPGTEPVRNRLVQLASSHNQPGIAAVAQPATAAPSTAFANSPASNINRNSQDAYGFAPEDPPRSAYQKSFEEIGFEYGDLDPYYDEAFHRAFGKQLPSRDSSYSKPETKSLWERRREKITAARGLEGVPQTSTFFRNGKSSTRSITLTTLATNPDDARNRTLAT